MAGRLKIDRRAEESVKITWERTQSSYPKVQPAVVAAVHLSLLRIAKSQACAAGIRVVSQRPSVSYEPICSRRLYCVQDTPIKAKIQMIERRHVARLVRKAGHDTGLAREWCGRSHGGWKAQVGQTSAWTHQLPEA